MLYRALFDLVLRRIPPEIAHTLAATSSRALTAPASVRKLLRRTSFPAGDVITVSALGHTFPSPLGAAAGIDKNVDWFDALGAIGFGFVEVGTVTPRPQTPNPSPTIVRILKDHALLNRMGFPNAGAERAARRLAARSGETLVGANIGKARDTLLAAAAADYAAVARLLAPHADYMTINVSSPNTAGLRDLLAIERLEPLVQRVQQTLAETNPALPLLVKISPDMGDEDVDAVADMAVRLGLAGIIAVNTTVDRTALAATDPATLAWFEGGGVSGPPLKARALALLRRLHARVGDRMTLVSIGGIESADDVWERLLAGATLVQAYTGFIYGGPGWPAQINRELARRVRQAGAGSIMELIGRDAPRDSALS
jgi:dihydroorotate dehydrogenase